MSAVSPSVDTAPAAAAAAQPTNQTQQKTTNTALKILSSFGEFIKNQGRSLWNNTIGVIVSGVLGCVKFVFQSVFGSAKKADEAAAEQPPAATTAATAATTAATAATAATTTAATAATAATTAATAATAEE